MPNCPSCLSLYPLLLHLRKWKRKVRFVSTFSKQGYRLIFTNVYPIHLRWPCNSARFRWCQSKSLLLCCLASLVFCNIGEVSFKFYSFTKHSLRYLGPKPWNNLTARIRNQPSLKQFKSFIRNQDLTVPSCKCQWLPRLQPMPRMIYNIFKIFKYGYLRYKLLIYL